MKNALKMFAVSLGAAMTVMAGTAIAASAATGSAPTATGITSTTIGSPSHVTPLWCGGPSKRSCN
jgi:hypothetical protein